MTTEAVREWRARCCETLGLAESAQAHEIKAAYRDLAKVWHPDRFTHDSRLQAKAQEKLKEINEAYRQLLAGTPPPRATRPPRDSTRHEPRATRHDPQATPRDARPAWEAREGEAREGEAREGEAREGEARGGPAHTRKGFDWRLLVPAVAFCATFAFFTPRLLPSNRAGDAATQTPAPAQAEAPSTVPSGARAGGESVQGAGVAEQKNSRARAEAETLTRAVSPGAAGGPREVTAGGAKEVASGGPKEAAARAPLPTVSVTLDPATNLLARPGCPGKLRVTFPAGSEPHAYCDAAHGRPEPSAQQEKEQNKSRLKSFAGRLASPSKWLPGKDAAGEPAKRSGAREQSPERD